ncbi:2231_t:CDS:1, partial [Ambispora gerdemannii]
YIEDIEEIVESDHEKQVSIIKATESIQVVIKFFEQQVEILLLDHYEFAAL